MSDWKSRIRVGDDTPKIRTPILVEEPKVSRVITTSNHFIVDREVAEWIYSDSNLRGKAGEKYTDIELVVRPPKKPGLLMSKLGLMLKASGKLYLSRELSKELLGVLNVAFANPQEIGDKVVWEKK